MSTLIYIHHLVLMNAPFFAAATLASLFSILSASPEPPHSPAAATEQQAQEAQQPKIMLEIPPYFNGKKGNSIKLDFPLPMVDAAAVGQAADLSAFSVTPALPINGKWLSRSSLKISLDANCKPFDVHELRLVKPMKSIDGRSFEMEKPCYYLGRRRSLDVLMERWGHNTFDPYILKMSNSDEIEGVDLTTLFAGAYYELDNASNDETKVPASIRALTAAEALTHWDYIQKELYYDKLSDKDKKTVEQMAPDAAVPGLWLASRCPLGKIDDHYRLYLPNIGSRDDDSKSFGSSQVLSMNRYNLGYYCRNEMISAGEYHVELDLGTPVALDGIAAQLEVLDWELFKYEKHDSPLLGKLALRDGVFAIDGLGFSLVFDEGASAKYIASYTLLSGESVRAYSKLIFKATSGESTYKLHCSAGLMTIVGIKLQSQDKWWNSDATTLLAPKKPYLSSSLLANGLQADGSRRLSLKYRNLEDVNARVIHLSADTETAVKSLTAYNRYYSELKKSRLRQKDDKQEQIKRIRASLVPSELLPGQLGHRDIKLPSGSHEREIKLDAQGMFPGVNRGMFFVDVRAKALADYSKAMDLTEDAEYGNQSLIQLTDLGLMWKRSGNQIFVYPYQLSTGAAVHGAQIEMLDAEGKLLGVAQPVAAAGSLIAIASHEVAWLRLSCGDDSYITEAKLDGDVLVEADVPAGINFDEFSTTFPSVQVYSFMDRSIYRPGELLRLKGLIRDLRGNVLSLPQGIDALELVVFDDQEKRELARLHPKLEADGSFELEYRIAKNARNSCSLRLEMIRNSDKDASSEDMRLLAPIKKSDHYNYKRLIENNRFYRTTVDLGEYRRNEFEISGSMKALGKSRDFEMTLQATRLSGAPEAGADVSWRLAAQYCNVYPSLYEDYLFGDHRAWDIGRWEAYYGGGLSSGSSGYGNSYNDSKLNEAGEGRCTLRLKVGDFPQRVLAHGSMRVANANGQSLSLSESAIYDPASLYVGMRLDSNYSNEAQAKALPMDILLVDTKGDLCAKAQKLQLDIKRKRSVAFRVGAFDCSQRRSESELLQVSTQDVELIDGKASLSLNLPETGEYEISLSGRDEDGREFRSAIKHHVWAKDPEWISSTGSASVRANKDMYKEGETAKLLFDTPIKGRLLVSVERERILRSFVVDVNDDKPIIELPLLAGDGPAVTVSLFMVQGTQVGRRSDGLPKLIHEQIVLKIDPADKRLHLQLDTPTEPQMTGSTSRIAGLVLDASKQPVAAALVTLFAVDEGTLQAGDYQNPNPLARFYNARAHSVVMCSVQHQIWGESGKKLDYGNKGVFIGSDGDEDGDGWANRVGSSAITSGGLSAMRVACLRSGSGGGIGESSLGGDGKGFLRIRSNFEATPLWQGRVLCDAQGRFSTELVNPDTLTRYRVIAVATSGVSRFGVAEASYEVSQSIMLEPSAPLTATLGDEIDVPVTLSMRPEMLPEALRDKSVRWELSLRGNAVAQPLQPNQTIELQGAVPKTLRFRVKMLDTGDAKFSWSIRPAVGQAGLDGHQDGLAESFEVLPPTPYLREVFFGRIASGASKRVQDWIKTEFNEQACADVTISPSPLAGMIDGLRQLRDYPYSCSEQLSARLQLLLHEKTLHEGMGMPLSDAAQRAVDIRAILSELRRRAYAPGLISYWPEGKASPRMNAYALLACSSAQKEGYADEFDNYLHQSAEAIRKAMISESPKAPLSAVVEHDALTNPLMLLYLSSREALTADYLDSIIEARRHDDEWETDTTKYLIAFVAHAIKHPDAAAYTQQAEATNPCRDANYTGDNPSLAVLKLLLEVQRNPKGEELAESMNMELRRFASSGRHSTVEASWMLQLIAGYIHGSALKEEQSMVNGQLSKASTPLLLDAVPLATLPAFAVEAAPVYVFGVVEGYTMVPQTEQVVDRGFRITRRYEKYMPDGTWQTSEDLRVGDVLLVTMEAHNTCGESMQYVALEDYMPAGLELVNPAVLGQRLPEQMMRAASSYSLWSLMVSYKHYEKDRIAIFVNSWGSSDVLRASYLARVVKSGTMKAPAAKAEMMYQPKIYGLSIPQSFVIKPAN